MSPQVVSGSRVGSRRESLRSAPSPPAPPYYEIVGPKDKDGGRQAGNLQSPNHFKFATSAAQLLAQRAALLMRLQQPIIFLFSRSNQYVCFFLGVRGVFTCLSPQHLALVDCGPDQAEHCARDGLQRDRQQARQGKTLFTIKK